MKITNFISKKSIALNVHPADKTEAIDMLVDLLMTAGTIRDKALVKRDVLRREAQGSTGLANGLATPHAQNSSVKKPSISIITVPEGVEFNSLDGKPARLLMLFAAPEKADDAAMTNMGRLAVLLMDPPKSLRLSTTRKLPAPRRRRPNPTFPPTPRLSRSRLVRRAYRLRSWLANPSSSAPKSWA